MPRALRMLIMPRSRRYAQKPACRLRRRIETLRPLLTQCRKLSQLTAHYYDPDFCRYDEYSL